MEQILIDNTKTYLPWIGLTKSQIAKRADEVVNQVLEEGGVLTMAEVLSVMEEFIKSVKKDARFIDYTREELAKSSGKSTTPAGSKIEAAEVGTKYDFDNCNDPVYRKLVNEKTFIDGEIKVRETFLKTIPPQGLEIRHEDELVCLYPPLKTSTSSYKITLAK